MLGAQKWLTSPTNRLVLALLLGGLLVRSLVALWLYPGFDEAYYYLYSVNLQLSYFDHPVLVALTTGFGHWLTGEVSQFTIRIGTLILYTASLIFLYLTSLRLFSARAAVLTLAIVTVVPIFQVGYGALTLPDSPLMFFWAACIYVAACEFFAEPGEYRPTYRLAVISVLVGLACLGKYHGFVLGVGLVGFCLTSPRHRHALASPWAWLGLGLFLVTISPILLWNAQHDWVSIRFQSNRGVPDGGYNILEAIGTFLSGNAYLFPTIGFPLWWVSLKTLWQQFFPTPLPSHPHTLTPSDLHLKQRLILWLSLPLMLIFAIIAGYTQVLPTWQVPGFWTATLLLGQQAVIWQERSARGVKRWLVGTGLVVTTAMIVALLHVATGTFQKPGQFSLFGGFIPPKEDPSVQLVDVDQLRSGFAQSPTLMAALQDASFIFTTRYYLAGQIGMALVPLNPKPITCFDNDLRGMAFWYDPEQWVGQNALYIVTEQFHQKKKLLTKYQAYFKSFQEIGHIPILRGGTVTEVFYVYEAKNLLKPYPRPYGDGIEQDIEGITE